MPVSQNIYAENDKTLWRKIREDLDKWRKTLRSEIRDLGVAKTSILPKSV